MTLARECIEAMGGFNKDADRSALLAVLRTLRERGPSDGMLLHATQPIWELHGPRGILDTMLAELIREIEEER